MTISGSDTAYQKEIRLRPAGDSLSFQDFSVFVVLQAGVRLQGGNLDAHVAKWGRSKGKRVPHVSRFSKRIH